jgi:NADH dehydrogenase/NADH:ubiquinone oxidoreductase subunit G
VVKGTVYGMTVSGERVSLYVDGKTVVNQPITEITKTTNNQTMVNYPSVSATPVLQLNGTAKMENGAVIVFLDEQTLSQYANTEDLTIIATPSGQTNGVYAELRGRELSIKENNNGTSNTKISWIIIGQRNVQNTALPDEVKATDFDTNLRSFVHSENDKNSQGTGLYWDGNKLNTGISPTAKRKH